MVKNLTLSIPDELAEKISSFQEVNWSAVARRCIERYVEARLTPELSGLMEKLREEKGQEYILGRKLAIDITDELGYKGLSEILREFWKEREEYEEFEEMGGPPPGVHYETPNDSIEKVLAKRRPDVKGSSDAFLRGIRETLIEIHGFVSKE